jgi:hypothetical protein
LLLIPPADTGDPPQEDLAKSGYMSERKVEIYCYYWRVARTFSLKTMVISQILCFFFSFLGFPPTGETGEISPVKKTLLQLPVLF